MIFSKWLEANIKSLILLLQAEARHLSAISFLKQLKLQIVGMLNSLQYSGLTSKTKLAIFLFGTNFIWD
jgi:hypothetical protein